jgi:hypothetical protein
MISAEDEVAESARQPLIELSIESWRFARLVARAFGKLDAGEAPRYTGQLRYFLKKLDESLELAHLRLVNLEGQPYDHGMAASPLNIADFLPEDQLVVNQMVEPIIMGPNGLVRAGIVILGKVAQE